MKILINTPDLSRTGGGVSNHYIGLKPYWTCNVTYNAVGARKRIPGQVILIYDFIKFGFLCAFGKFNLILLNPSLRSTAIIRDAFFLKIAKCFNKKVVIFFHGWNDPIANEIDENPKKFLTKFQKADSLIVLASTFKKKLVNWGIEKPIYLSSTKVNNALITDFNIKKKEYNKSVLFLARIEENKGIFITLKTFQLISKSYPNSSLKVAGEGTQLANAKKFTKDNLIPNVEFLGNISGETLINTFKQSSLYILPTTHGEGMPTSILEAMAFGLPIISRPVGGLTDFFEQEKMGYLIESLNPNQYAEKILVLFQDNHKCESIGEYNHQYAKDHFMASIVAKSLEEIFNITHNSN